MRLGRRVRGSVSWLLEPSLWCLVHGEDPKWLCASGGRSEHSLRCLVSGVEAQEEALVAAGRRPGGDRAHPLTAPFATKCPVPPVNLSVHPHVSAGNDGYMDTAVLPVVPRETNRSFQTSNGWGAARSASRLAPGEGEPEGVLLALESGAVSQVAAFRGMNWEHEGNGARAAVGEGL